MGPENPLGEAGVELRDILLKVERGPLDGPNALSQLMSLEESKRRVLIILAIDHLMVDSLTIFGLTHPKIIA